MVSPPAFAAPLRRAREPRREPSFSFARAGRSMLPKCSSERTRAMGSGLAEGFGSLFLLIFAAAFPIVNPAGSALIFLDMTRRAAHRTREGLARRVAF